MLCGFLKRNRQRVTTLGPVLKLTEIFILNTSSKKQLLLSEIFPPTHGGSGRWFYEIYRRLTPGAFVLVVNKSIHDTSELDEHYPQKIIREDLHVRQRVLSNTESVRRYGAISKRIISIVRQNEIQSIHAARPLHEGLIAYWMRLRYGIPYLCFVHGEDINVATTSRELKFLNRRILRGATKLIANSNFTADLLRNDWDVPDSTIELMHPGVDASEFPYLSDRKSNLRYTQKGDLVLLTVGRLQERKGHDAVIHSLARLRDKFPNLRYLIAGDGEREVYLKQLVAEHALEDRVLFLGAVSETELRQCYRECDVFVMANRAVGKDCEGFGIVFLEAQSQGIPVISGTDGGTADAMRDGITGFRVDCQDPRNPVDLIEAIEKLASNPEMRQEMGMRGRQFVLERFDWTRLESQARAVLMGNRGA